MHEVGAHDKVDVFIQTFFSPHPFLVRYEIHDKVCGCCSITFLNWAPMFDECVVR